MSAETTSASTTLTETTEDAERVAQRERNQAALALIRSWKEDQTGYDERVWPFVKRSLEDNRLF